MGIVYAFPTSSASPLVSKSWAGGPLGSCCGVAGFGSGNLSCFGVVWYGGVERGGVQFAGSMSPALCLVSKQASKE